MTPTTTPTTSRGAEAIAPPPTRVVGLAFGAAIALSAFLLFQVQPLIGKYILPWFGGSAGVWTTCMLFFQMLLLAGYLYAHLSVTYLPPRAQAAVHATFLLAAALLTLPIIPADRWKPLDADQPVRHILLLLFATLGLPYFVLSATAPLLQRWFARLSPGRSPYRLYALSNVASLAALLSFPFLVEPLLSRRAQAWTWSAGYLGFAACLCTCAVMLWRNAPSPAHDQPDARSASTAAPAPTPVAHYVLWLALPACASLLFLAVTNKLCMEVAAVPFLWIIPLAIYLLTFIISFDSPRWYRRGIFGPLLAVALGAAAYALHAGDEWLLVAQIALYAAVLFIACMVCHGELVALKPDPSRLTAFYLFTAAGGALGGLSVGVLAPILFDRFLELHVGLALAWVLFLAALAADPKSPLHAFRRAGVWYLLVVAGVLLVVGLYAEVTLRRAEVDDVARDRNFYGVLHVHHADEGGAPVLILQHNNIVHGMQFTDESRRMEPTTYFRRTSGVGRILTAPRPRGGAARVGIVGLGVGTLAAYGNPGDRFRFYELDVAVEHFARKYFTFISGSRADVEVIPGDARLSMEREPPQDYDLLVLDAFTGDAVPVHLLTREAVATYLRHTSAAGVIAMNISNVHLDLAFVVEALAADAKMDLLFVHDQHSIWALLARQPQSLDPARPFASKPTERRPTTLWTDDYASMFQVLKWRRQ